MKRILLAALVTLFSYIGLSAQTYGYVYTQRILEQIPEFKSAQNELDRLKDLYDQNVKAELKKVEVMFNQYQSQKSTLTPNQREARERDIIAKERAVKDMQKAYFAQDGELAKRGAKLLDPIRERVNAAVAGVAKQMNLAVVVDMDAVQGVMYTDPKLDITAKVIDVLIKEAK